MDQSVVTKPPYFDLAALRRETDELARKYAGQEAALRKALVARLRDLIENARLEAQHQLERDGNGRASAEGLCAFQDALIKLAYEFTTNHVYLAENPSAAERMAIVAQGGYGRGLLAPESDIDLLFLLPYSRPPGARASPSTCSIFSGISASRSGMPRAPSINVCACRCPT